MKIINVRLLNTIALGALVLLTGCASITGTTGQNVSVETRTKEGKAVIGAACELTNSKGKWFVTTPGSVGIRRSNDDMLIVCTKEGFEPGRANAISDTKGSMFGNIIFGGGIGAIIDHNQGTAYEYPTLLQIILGAVTKIETKPSENNEQPTGDPAPGTAAVAPAAPPPPAPEVSVAAAGGQSEVYRKLKELDTLRKEGVLTQQEFDAKKAEILKGL